MQIRRTTWLLAVLALVLYKLLSAQVNGSSEWRSARARLMSAKAQLANLNIALELYRKDVGHYPTPALGLAALVGQTSDGIWDGPYLQSGQLPADPWGNPYRYSLSSLSHDLPSVRSVGPDGVDGTKDDLTSSQHLAVDPGANVAPD